LSDPEQPDGEGQQACYKQKSAHAFLPIGLLLSRRGIDDVRGRENLAQD
jgi:hypothetical protein